MILFLSDWNNYPEAIIDTQTTNQSFIRLSALYREMGIENHAFLLALHNPALQGIDPHSPDLTHEQMLAISVEVAENPWYYFREVAMVPGIAGPDPIRYRAHRGNIATYWFFFNHVMIILEQIRQTGKSFAVDALMIYLMNGGTNNTQINLITKDETLRTRNLSRLKEIQGLLPPYLNLKTRADLANTETMTIKALGNEYLSHLPNKSPKLALNVGRGLTSPIFQIDEAAFIFNIEITLPAALAAGSAARDRARENNAPYGTILTTTAGKKDDRDGKFVYRMIAESAIGSEKLYDSLDEEDLHKTIRLNSRSRGESILGEMRGKGNVRVYLSYNHTQLGFSDEWLERTLEETNARGEDANRDFFNIWTSGSQQHPLTPEMNELIRQSQIDPLYTEITKPLSYIIRWYIPENEIKGFMAKNKTIMSLDTSDAAGGDDIAMTMRSISTGEVIASGNFNETNLIAFAEWIANLITEYTNMTTIIERRSTGSMLIDYLLLILPTRNIDPFKRLYNQAVQYAQDDPERFKEIQKTHNKEIYVKYKKLFGFATSAMGATSRSELYSTTLQNAAKYTYDTVRDKPTINQLLSLVIKNGRVDHADGEHDDNCIAWLLSYWLMTLGRNLEYYGIPSSLPLSQCRVRIENITSGSYYNEQYKNSLERQIEGIIEELKKTRDEYVAYKYEHRLKLLLTELQGYSQSAMSVDEMIAQIRQQRSIRLRMLR